MLLQLVCGRNVHKVLRHRDIGFALLLHLPLVDELFLGRSLQAVVPAFLCLIVRIIWVNGFLRRSATILELFIQMHPIFLVVESLVIKPVELLVRHWSVGSVLGLRQVEIVILTELLSILRECGVVCSIAVFLHVRGQSC